MSSPAPYDWKSLIGPGINLGMKVVGDQLMPDPSVQNARTNSQNSEVDRELALAKMANAQKLRTQMLPGMYTHLGYSPTQGRQMANDYSANASMPASAGYTSGGGSKPGLGSAIGKTALGVGLNMAPAAIGSLLGRSAPAITSTMTRQAIQ